MDKEPVANTSVTFDDVLKWLDGAAPKDREDAILADLRSSNSRILSVLGKFLTLGNVIAEKEPVAFDQWKNTHEDDLTEAVMSEDGKLMGQAAWGVLDQGIAEHFARIEQRKKPWWKRIVGDSQSRGR